MTRENGGALLQARGVSKNFGGLRALDGVDLEVEAGKVVGLIGPNGSGKTTLFNIITGVYAPTAGEVRFLGRRITGWAPHLTSRLGIARTFQQICLFSELTVLENVMAGMLRWQLRGALDWLADAERRHRERAVELLEYVGLAGKERQRAGALPYGDQRRLEVARALATGPRLLLLDEPLAGMNPGEIAGFMQLTEQINRSGITILLIEHNVRAVMSRCNPIYVFDHGRRIAVGTASEIQRDDVVIKAYLGEEIEDAAG